MNNTGPHTEQCDGREDCWGECWDAEEWPTPEDLESNQVNDISPTALSEYYVIEYGEKFNSLNEARSFIADIPCDPKYFHIFKVTEIKEEQE